MTTFADVDHKHQSILLCIFDEIVTGALCRKTDPKIATAPETQSRSKDQNKDKIIQSRIKR